MELSRAKHTADQHLIVSNARWTIVRATAFLELWDEIMATPIVFGRGENSINFVSVSDVVAVVERAVLDPVSQPQVESGSSKLQSASRPTSFDLGNRKDRGAPPPLGLSGYKTSPTMARGTLGQNQRSVPRVQKAAQWSR
jgi:NADH dehydrogenase